MSSPIWNTVSGLETFVQDTLETIARNPWGLLLRLLLTICIITRTLTQFRSSLRAAHFKSSTKAIPRSPYWIPYLANSPQFSFYGQSRLLDQSRRYQSNVFGLTLSGLEYVVVTSPALQAVLADRSSPVTTQKYEAQRMSCFFGHRRIDPSTHSRVSRSLIVATGKARIVKMTRLLETHAYNFISPSKSWVDQAQWERAADVKILETSPRLSVSASLATLTRGFSAYIILSSILGTSFSEANPSFVDDFFAFSAKYGTFMTGLPYWIAPGLGPPALSRERCLLALDGLLAAMMAESDGKSMSGTGTGMLYDLDDVSPAIWNIIENARRTGLRRPTDRELACETLEVIWNKTFSTVNIVIWTLIYLSEPNNENESILEAIKTEAKKVIEVTQNKNTGLPIEEPPHLKFSLNEGEHEIEKACPTLHASILEVIRLETQPEEYLTVTEDFILSADATPDPTSTKKPALLSNVVERYQMKEGDRIYAAYGATNRDAYYWDRPEKFLPKRHKLEDGVIITNSPQLPKMRSNSQFDCIPEVMCIVTALMSLHDFDVPSHPSTKIIAGVGVPKGSVRATITRRKF